jgi:hypothetical protein
MPRGPHSARAKEIVATLEAGNLRSDEVFAAFADLDALPAEIVRDALGAWIGPTPAPPALRLHTHGTVVRDADVLDLGPIADEQLRLAGRSWDGVDLAPEERLDGEVEGSFAGTLERRVLANTDEKELFDVLRFADDAGVVFRAGTAEIVALIAYGRVEMRDARVRTAIEEALDEAAVLPFGAGVAIGARERSDRESVIGARERSDEDERATVEAEAEAAPPKKKRAPAKKKTSAAAKKTTATKKKSAAKKKSAS